MTNRDRASIGREIAVIVLAGIAVGLAYNQVGRLSTPERGIPWIAERTELPSLDSLQAILAPPDAAAPETAAPVRVEDVPASRQPRSTSGATKPAAHAARPEASEASRASVGPTDAVPAAGTPAATPASPPEGGGTTITPPTSGGPLPFIPDVATPIKVGLSATKKYFDARAALFIDARDAAEFGDGHIPGAIHLTYGDAVADPERMKAIPAGGRPIIAYCEGGACEASINLAEALIKAGHHRVLVFTGGWPEWTAAGYPTERGAAPDGGSR